MGKQITMEFYGFDETIEALGRIPPALLISLEHELHRGANMIARTAKALCPVGKREFTYGGIGGIKETSLGNSIEVVKGEEELEYYIGTDHPAAEYMEYGTRKHDIPLNRQLKWGKKALRFINREGNIQFAKYVQHPGTQPQPFLEPALFENQEEIQNNIFKVFKKTIETYGGEIE